MQDRVAWSAAVRSRWAREYGASSAPRRPWGSHGHRAEASPLTMPLIRGPLRGKCHAPCSPWQRDHLAGHNLSFVICLHAPYPVEPEE